MQDREVFLTKEGLKKLEAELEELKTVRRREIAENIKIARGFGDLSENAEYDEAKNEQAVVEERISKIEGMLRNAKTIDEVERPKDLIGIGSTVRIFDEEFADEMKFTIVGSAEADPLKGLISNESPVGKALLGKKDGERVEVMMNGKIISYKVLEIV
jgi:transcription elongation factor GreA